MEFFLATVLIVLIGILSTSIGLHLIKKERVKNEQLRGEIREQIEKINELMPPPGAPDEDISNIIKDFESFEDGDMIVYPVATLGEWQVMEDSEKEAYVKAGGYVPQEFTNEYDAMVGDQKARHTVHDDDRDLDEDGMPTTEWLDNEKAKMEANTDRDVRTFTVGSVRDATPEEIREHDEFMTRNGAYFDEDIADAEVLEDREEDLQAEFPTTAFMAQMKRQEERAWLTQQ